jgi:hypothetical protein
MPKVPLELALFKAIWFRKTSERGRSELSKGGHYGGSPIRGIVFDAGRSSINVPGPKRAERHGDSRSADQPVCTGLQPRFNRVRHTKIGHDLRATTASDRREWTGRVCGSIRVPRRLSRSACIKPASQVCVSNEARVISAPGEFRGLAR